MTTISTTTQSQINNLDRTARIAAADNLYRVVSHNIYTDYDREISLWEDMAQDVWYDITRAIGTTDDYATWTPDESCSVIADRRRDFAAATWAALHSHLGYDDADKDAVLSSDETVADYCEEAETYLCHTADVTLRGRGDARDAAVAARVRAIVDNIYGLRDDDGESTDEDDYILDAIGVNLDAIYTA